jgi:anti-sigma regulatory factor (Ser/Thr protein kinase)
LIGDCSVVSIALRLALHLPRDAATVPLVRRLLAQSLQTLGVASSCRDDIGLIVTEACTNVIEHAQQTDDYEITIEVSSSRCVIHVVNAGAAVDPSLLSPSPRSAVPASLPASAVLPPARASVAQPVVPAARPAAGVHVAQPAVPVDPAARAPARPASADPAASPQSPRPDSAPPAPERPASAAPAPERPAAASSAPARSAPALQAAARPAPAQPRPAAAGAVPPVPAYGRSTTAAMDPLLDAVLDEHGRGLHIIRSLADELYLTPALAGGLVLQAVITLRWTADAAVWQHH